jgi:Ser/Thr protein kinase RdoA (MazF antagonist)
MPRIGTVIRDVYRRPGADAVPAHLERRYGIEVAGTTRLDTGVFRVERRDGPPWVARVFITARPLSRVEDDAEVLRFLADQDFPAERCAHPEPVSEMDGRAVLVTEFVPGKPWPTRTPAAWRELGALAGRVHSLAAPDGAARRPAGSLHHLPDYEGGPERDLAAAAALLADLDGRVPEAHKATYQALLELLPRGDDCSGLPHSFVHPDLAEPNTVAAADGPVLVDWTGAGSGPRLASLAMLLRSAGPQNAASVMRGYAEHQQLTAEELDRLEGVLWIRPLWFAAWRCFLAVVSPRVTSAFVPDPSRVAALAEAVRASAS